MVDLSVGINAQNLSSAGVVVAVQGVVNNIANGEAMQAGMAVNLGDAVQTARDASIVIRFLEGGALAMGANQSALIDEELIERLQTFEEPSDTEEDVEFASLIEALERGESIEDLLPATAAGGEGAGGSSLGSGVRFEYTGGQVLPQAGFGSGAGLGGATALGDGTGANDGSGVPAPGELSLTVVQDANGDGFINIVENDGQVTVSIALPDGLLPGSTIVVNGVVVGLTQADIEAGNVAVNLPLPEDGETLEISATPFNPAGISGETSTTSITVDISPPLLTVDPLAPTNDTTPTITGTGEPGNQVTITDPSGKVIGTTTVDPEGKWEITPTDPIEEPGTDITVSTVDPAGNESTEEENIVIDTTAPGGGTEKPTVSIPEAESGVNKEEIENGIQVIVGLPSGTGPGDTVVVTVTLPGGEKVDVTSVVEPGEEGSKEVTVPVNVLPSPPDGGYVVQVTVVDPAGNVSLPSDPVDFVIDTIAPGEGGEITAPIVTIPEAEDNVDEEELEDGVQVQIVLPTGTEPGDKVTVKVTLPGGGTEEIEYIAGPEDGGNVEVTIPTSILPEPPGGEYQVVVDVTDKAGNTSEPSTPEPFVIDIVDETPPPQPSISFVEDSNKDGYFNFEESTANVDNEIDVVITLDPNTAVGSVLSVSIDGVNTTVPVTQQLLNEGQFIITVPQPSDGSVLSVVAKVSSEANVDSPNAEGSLIVDVTDFKGATPGLSVELSTDGNDDGTISSAELLNSSRAGGVDVVVSLPAGAKAGDKLIVNVTGQSPREIIVSDTDIGNGAVQFSVDALGHGQTLDVEAQIFDAAGNVSDVASDSATMDLQPMRSPAIVFVDDTSGDGEVNKEEVGTKTELTVDIILPAGVEPGDKLIVVVDGGEREIPITQQIIDEKKVSITVPTPDDGEKVNVKAKVEDKSGESGPESEKEVEIKAPDLSSGLSVLILEDSDDDGELSVAELNGASEITVEVNLPDGAKEGDTLILEVNNVPRTITITDAHVQSGSIEVLTAAPSANQTVQVKAEVFDADGNSSEPATDSVSMAANTVSGAPSVNFTDDLDGNGFLNAAEAAGLANLSIQFDLPAGLNDGDKLVYQLNGGAPITLNVRQADIDAGFITTSSLVPQSGTTVSISSHVEQAGVAGPEGQGELVIDTSDLSALSVEVIEDVNNDGLINLAERQGALDVKIDLPVDAEVGDRLVLISNSGAPRAYTLTAEQLAAGEVVVSYDMPADGVTFEIKATLTDAAGNTSGEVSDSAQIDISGLDAPIITFVDDNNPGDGLLNTGELAGKSNVGVEISLPVGAQIDDVLVYSVDGGPEQSVVITQSHIDAGLVSISLPAPQDGSSIEVSASVRDKAGNDGQQGEASVKVDLSDLNTGLSVSILEDADNNGVISIAEQDGAVDVRIELPVGAQVGDSLRIEAAANTPTLITITADHLSNGYVDVSLNSVSQGNDFVVSASISDAAGNSSDPVSASALVEGKAQVKPGIRVVEDANNDGKIVAKELNGDVDVEVTLPATVQLGDNVVLKTNTGQELSQVITQADIDRGSITFQVSPVADGETLSLESYIENSDGEAGESATESVDFVTSSSSVPSITSIFDDVAPIVGKMASGAISNDSKPQLQGLGERGDVINVYLDGVEIGKADVRDDGSWVFDVPNELAEDDYIFTVSSTNSDGNESAQSAPFNYTVDLTAPTSIINFVGFDDVGPVTGPIADGDIIDDSVPTFSGRAEPGTTINIYDNGKLIASGIEVGPTGNWSFEPSPALANGGHAISASSVDKAGNESDPVGPLRFTIDTATPGSPSIVSVIDDVPDVPGGENETIAHEGITNDNLPTITGTGPIGATITVYNKDPNKGGSKIGEAVVDGEGKWSFTPAAGEELVDGKYEFYADASIAGGPASDVTGPYTITVDTVAPDKPGADSLKAEDDIGAVTGPINNGETTDDSKPRLHGKVTEPNGKVVITIDPGTDNERVVTVDVDEEGNWEYTPEPPLVDGPHSVQIAVIDEAGNGPGDPSDPLTFTVDTSDITVSIDKAVDDVPSPGEAPGTTQDINDGGLTNDVTPLIVGSAKVGAEVTLQVNGKTYGPVTADGDGVWKIQITDDLPEGPVEFTATAKDAAGNDVEDTFTLNVDVTAGSAPIINDADDNVGKVQGKLSSGDHTDDNTPKINGTGTPGETIRIYKDGDVVDEVKVKDDGSWTYTPTDALPEGEHIYTATSVDPAGNESQPSDPFVLTIDRTSPDAVENFKGFDDVGSVTGEIVNNSTIDDAVPEFTGEVASAEFDAGSTVTVIIRDGSGNLVQVIENVSLNAGANAGDPATWTASPSPALGNGSFTVTAKVVDKAGNESDESNGLSFDINTASPGSPSIVRVLDDVGNEDGRTVTISPDGVSNDSRPTVEGTGPIGATITVYNKDPNKGGSKIGEAVVDGEGKWSFTPAAGEELVDGKYEFYADASIAGGPASDVTGPYTITVDTVAPDKPGADSLKAEDDIGAVTGPINNGETTDDSKPRLHGKVTEPNGKVVITIDPGTDNERVVTVDVDEEGNWEYTPEPPLVDGPHSVQIAVIDEAGNGPGDPSDPLTFTVDTSDITVSIDKAVDDVPSPGEAPGTTQDINDGGLTNDVTPLIVGSAKVGAEVTLQVNGKTYGPVTADGDGVWKIQITDDLPEGPVEFTATAKDAAGNDVEDTFTLNVDVTAGPAPIINDADDNVGKVQGKLSSGDHTDDNTPKINGTGTPGETIRIYKDGDVVDEVKVKDDGSWTYTPTDALPEGEHTYTATSVDSAGNESQPSDPFVLTIDRTSPDDMLSFIGTDDVGLVQGTITHNSTIDDATPTFSGTVENAELEAGATVTVIIRDGSGNLVQVIENVSLSAGVNAGDPATWEVNPSPALASGSYSVAAKVVDKAGNESDETAALDFELDTSTPGAPSIVSVIDDVPEVAGGPNETITHEGITNDNRPTITGTGPKNATIRIYDGDPDKGGTKLFETTSDGQGNWSYTPTAAQALADDTYNFYADARAANGQESPVTGPYSIEVDTTIPNPPNAAGTLQAEDDQGQKTGRINEGDTTDDAKPLLHGTVDVPNGKVVVTIDAGTPDERSVTVDVNDKGEWNYTPDPALVDGPHSVQIALIDEAGNGPGDPSDPLSFIVDTSAVTVTIDKAVDDVPNPGEPADTTKDINDGDKTNDTTPLIVGSAKVGAEVTLEVNGKTYGPVTADGNGEWKIQIPDADALPEGAVTFKATAEDASGNEVEDTFTITIDTTPNAVPVINDADDNVGNVQGKLNNGDHTDDNTPKINGTGTAGETIRIYKDGSFVDEVIVQPDNSWTYTPTTALPEGEHVYTASSVDDVGNESVQTGPFSITVDRTSPDDITNFIGTDDVGLVTGTIVNDSTIDDATPTFSGEVNAAEVAMDSTVTVIIRDENDNVVQTITGVALTAGANPGDPATWSTDPSPALGNGSYKVTAKVVDKAGNESNETDALRFDIDTATPGAPSIVSVIDDVPEVAGGPNETIAHEGITNDDRPTITGTGPKNATIRIYDGDPDKGGTKLFETTSDGQGNWSYTPTAAQALDDDTYTFYADARAANGQVSPSTGPYTITVDTEAPEKPDLNGTLNATDDQGQKVGPINEGDTTDDAKPLLDGTVDVPNGKVVVIIDGGTPAERRVTVDVDDQGKWNYTPEPALVDGPHSVQIALIDEAGNGPGDPSDPLSFIVDTSAVTVTIDKAVDDVPNPGEPADTTKDINDGDKTNDTTPLIVGSAKVGAEVTLEVNGKTYGPVTADGNGEWKIQIPDADALPEGAVTFKATAEDASGNEVEDTFTITIDTTPNAVPVINDADDNVGNVQGKLNNGDHTDDNTPKINGTGTAGETIRIYKDGSFVDEVIVQPDNSWTYTPTTALPEGEHVYTASSVDDVGNESVQTGPFSITVDRTSPDDITNFIGTDDVGLVTGTIVNDSTIDDATPTFSGEVNAAEVAMDSTVTVIIRDENDNVVQTITGVALTAGANPGDPATWSTDPSPALGNGSYKVTAKVVDKAGNESNETDALRFDIDTATPGAPSIVSVIDDVPEVAGGPNETIAHEGITNDDRPTITGTGPKNATIRIYDGDPDKGGTKLFETTSDGQGNWSYTPTAAQALDDDTYTFYADARAANGQVSPSTGPYTITVDTEAPEKPDLNGTLNATDDQGQKVGPINEGDTTDDAKPLLDGTVDVPNGKVVVIIDGGTPAERRVTVDVDDQGKWNYTPEPALVDGPHSVQIALIDEAGNGPGDPSDPLSFIVDTSAVTVTIDKAVDDVPNPGEPADTTKDINDGDKTNDTTPLIVGSAKVGAEVTLEVNGKTYGPVTADGNGEWKIQIPDADALPEGAVTFKATAEDASGNEVEDTFTITIDTTPNAVPVINDADDNVGNVQGKLNSGDHTDDNTPKINGTGTAGETIRIYKDGSFVDEVIVQPDNSWTYTPTTALPEGEHVYTASSVDDVGNESVQTGPFSITVDRTSPDDITNFIGTDDVGLVTGTIVNDSTIDDATPTFSGEVNAAEVAMDSTVTVIIRDENDNVVQTITGVALTAGANPGDPATWSTDPSPALGNGSYKVTAKVVDKAGNESNETDALRFDIDTATPGAPSIVRVVDNVNDPVEDVDISDGGITNDDTPTVHGTGPSNATITLYSADPNGLSDAEKAAIALGTFTTGSDGKWNITPSDLDDGVHTFYADARGANGQVSPSTGPYTITVDTSVPNPPDITITGTLNAEDDQGDQVGPISEGDTTDDAKPRLHGTVTEPNGKVTVIIDGGTPNERTATVDVDDQGNWEYTPEPPLTDGQHSVQIALTDEAGNGPSAPSNPLSFIVDTTAITITIDKAVDDVPNPGEPADTTKDINDGEKTNDTTPLIVGSAKVGAEVTLEVNGKTYGPVTADGNGEWKIQIPNADALPEGVVTFKATAEDASGNEVEDTFTITIDTTPNAVPVITDADDNVGNIQGKLNNGDHTDDNTPKINGTGTAGETIRIYKDGSFVAEVTVQPDNSWTYTPTTALPEGEHVYTASSVDDVGNESAQTGPFSITVDRTAPDAVTSFAGFDDVGTYEQIADNSVIDDNTPTFEGTVKLSDAADGVHIKLYLDDGLGGDPVEYDNISVNNQTGAWTYDPSPALGNGTYTVFAVVVDEAGNESSASDDLTFTINTATPGAPSIVRVLDDVDNTGGRTDEVAHKGLTDDATPTVEGTGPSGATIRIYDGDPSSGGVLIDTATVLADGTWSYTVKDNSPLADGKHDFYADAVFGSGTPSPVTGPYTITIDTELPEPPLSLRAFDDQGQVTGFVVPGSTIDDTTPTFSGKAEARATVHIYNEKADGTIEKLGTTTADDNGDWSFQETLFFIKNEEVPYKVFVTQTDEAGNGESDISDVLDFILVGGIDIDIDNGKLSLKDNDAADNVVTDVSQAGQPVGVTAAATNLKANEITTSYSFENYNGDLFEINPITGQVTLARDATAADIGSHDLTIKVSTLIITTGEERSASKEFTVSVAENVELNPITDENGEDDSVYSDASVGDEVGVTARAIDANVNDVVSYRLIENAGGLFTINQQTGVVTLAREVETSDIGTKSITVVAESSDGSQKELDFEIVVSNKTYENSADVLSGSWNGDSTPDGDAQVLAASANVTATTTTFEAVAGQAYQLTASISVDEEAGKKNIVKIEVLGPDGSLIEERNVKFNGKTENSVDFSINTNTAGEYTVRISNVAPEANVERTVSIDSIAVAGADASQLITPLVLDLDGDGTETISKTEGVKFDIDADGKLDVTGWVASDDALLVYDRNQDQQINDGSELFGAATQKSDGTLAKDGFEALRELDSNQDGVFDANDEAYSHLQLWQDRNSDGQVQDGELFGLDEAGVISINLDAQTNDEIDNGNIIGLSSSYTDKDGNDLSVDDVWFGYDSGAGDNSEAIEIMDLIQDAEVEIPELSEARDIPAELLGGQDKANICYFDSLVGQENIDVEMIQGLVDTQKSLLDH